MIFYDKNKQKQLSSNWIFLDTGILSDFSENEDCNHALLELFPNQLFIVDPLVRLEFLRNTFAFDYVLKKESLLSDEPFVDCPSPVDLVLMGRSMLYTNSCIVTTDLGDYPAEFFLKKNVVTIESDNANRLIHWQIVQFDAVKFEKHHARLSALINRDH